MKKMKTFFSSAFLPHALMIDASTQVEPMLELVETPTRSMQSITVPRGAKVRGTEGNHALSDSVVESIQWRFRRPTNPTRAQHLQGNSSLDLLLGQSRRHGHIDRHWTEFGAERAVGLVREFLVTMRSMITCSFYKKDTGISFASWMPFAVPPMFICLFIAWLWLQLVFFVDLRELFARLRCRRSVNESSSDEECQHRKRVTMMLQRKYDALGSFRCN